MKSFEPPRRILMGPGPSDVSPRVLAALSRQTIGHLDPAFIALMDGLQVQWLTTPDAVDLVGALRAYLASILTVQL